MRVLEFFLDLLFPPKCILCSRLLQHQETDLCKTCRLEAPTCSGRKKSISFVTAVGVDLNIAKAGAGDGDRLIL